MVQCNAGPGEDLRSGTINHQLSINFGGGANFMQNLVHYTVLQTSEMAKIS